MKLTEFANSYPHTLSGGMKQRAAIARALAMEPRILLMDEPFAALDALTRAQMQEELLQLWEETKFTVLFVTHSISEAIRIGTRILVLSAHPGQVKAEVNSGDCDEASFRSCSSMPDAWIVSAAVDSVLEHRRGAEDVPADRSRGALGRLRALAE